MVATLAGLAVFAWAVLDQDSGQSNHGASVPSPEPSTATGFTIERPQDTKLIFHRDTPGISTHGLWISNLDGSDSYQLVGTGDELLFIGAAPDPSFGDPFLYYVRSPDQGRYRRDVIRTDPGGHHELVLSIEGRQPSAHIADIHPDCRLLVYTDGTSLSLFDLLSKETREVPIRVADNPCLQFSVPENCDGISGPNWSPDGTRLLVTYTQRLLMLDPFSDSQAIPLEGCCYGWWSPSGKSVCSLNGGRTSPNKLFVHSAPNWRARTFLADYQPEINRTPSPLTTSYLRKSIGPCSWLSDDSLAVTHETFIDPEARQFELLTLDVGSGEVRSVARHEGTPTLKNASSIPGRNMAIFQARRSSPQVPVLYDLATGRSVPLITHDSWIVATIPSTQLERRPVVDPPSSQPVVSLLPDDGTIQTVFFRRDSTLWKIEPDGTQTNLGVELSAPGGIYQYASAGPLTSPDGRRAAFTAPDGNVWVYDVEAGDVIQVSTEAVPADEAYASSRAYVSDWAPDSTRLVYYVQYESGLSGMPSPVQGFYLADILTGETRKLDGVKKFVIWSALPDEIVIDRSPDGPWTVSWALWNLETGATRDLFAHPLECTGVQPSVGGGGRLLAYACGQGRAHAIIAARPDNTDRHFLLDSYEGEHQTPMLSPDATRFIYVHYMPNTQGSLTRQAIELFDLNTRKSSVLMAPAEGCSSQARGWLDANTVLAFQTYNCPPQPGTISDIRGALYAIDVNSGAQTLLADNLDGNQ